MFRRLVASDLKMIFRNRQALFWALAFPIMFTIIFGLFDFESLGETTIAVYGEDPARRAAVEEGLRRSEVFTFEEEYRTVGEARAALRDGELDFVVDVRRDGAVEVSYTPSQADRNRIILPVIGKVLDELTLQISRAPRLFRLEGKPISGRDVQYYDFVLPGLVGMAVMTYGIIGLASTVASYRSQKILKRILATPLDPRTFLGAIVVAHLLLALVQSALVLVTGVTLFGGDVRGSLLYIAAFVLLGNLTFLNIGFMVASRAETVEAASGLGNAVSMPMMFFSGVFFPTASLPWILPTLTAFLPLSPLVDAVRRIAVESVSITDLWSNLAQLAAWALVSFLVASRMFRFARA